MASGLFALRQERDELSGYAMGLRGVRDAIKQTWPDDLLARHEVKVFLDAMTETAEKADAQEREAQASMSRIANEVRSGLANIR